MLDEYVGRKVVIDFGAQYVCMGLLKQFDADFLDVRHADLHDLRDTDTSRENYVAASVATGIKRNRKRVLIFRREVVAISLFDDVVEQ